MLNVIVAEGVLHKQESSERGALWQTVADQLNALPGFEVTSRSMKDLFYNQVKKHKTRMAKEEASTDGRGHYLTEAQTL